jgi:hypothetical protein
MCCSFQGGRPTWGVNVMIFKNRLINFQGLRAIYTKQENLVGRHKISQKLELFNFCHPTDFVLSDSILLFF